MFTLLIGLENHATENSVKCSQALLNSFSYFGSTPTPYDDPSNLINNITISLFLNNTVEFKEHA